MHTRSLVAD